MRTRSLVNGTSFTVMSRFLVRKALVLTLVLALPLCCILLIANLQSITYRAHQDGFSLTRSDMSPEIHGFNDFQSDASQSAVEKFKDSCRALRYANMDFAKNEQAVVSWLCASLGHPIIPSTQLQNQANCRKAVVYQPIGRLGNIMGLYSIIYSFSRRFGVTGYVETKMWNTLHNIFPHITLKKFENAESVSWKQITYQHTETELDCSGGPDDSNGEFYWITNYPDRNGIDVFHPYYSDLKKEFEFSATLQSQAQQFLHYARGNRTSVTFIGFHIRRTDYREYIQKNYNMTVPEQDYYDKCLQYYRERFRDALFIVSSDDMAYVRRTFLLQNQDMVMAGNGALTSPGRDMAILAACNHSIVTVGTYGFWGAYLAGGTVLTPEAQTHQSRGDRGVPLLEIQLAGATNWIAIS